MDTINYHNIIDKPYLYGEYDVYGLQPSINNTFWVKLNDYRIRIYLNYSQIIPNDLIVNSLRGQYFTIYIYAVCQYIYPNKYSFLVDIYPTVNNTESEANIKNLNRYENKVIMWCRNYPGFCSYVRNYIVKKLPLIEDYIRLLNTDKINTDTFNGYSKKVAIIYEEHGIYANDDSTGFLCVCGNYNNILVDKKYYRCTGCDKKIKNISQSTRNTIHIIPDLKMLDTQTLHRYIKSSKSVPL